MRLSVKQTVRVQARHTVEAMRIDWEVAMYTFGPPALALIAGASISRDGVDPLLAWGPVLAVGLFLSAFFHVGWRIRAGEWMKLLRPRDDDRTL
jgi:hypothetical protein